MASSISAGTTSSTALVATADTTGILELKTNNGTTALTIDTNQRTAFVAGTAALPAITTTGDTNTGIFFPAADTVGVATGGSERVRVDSSGNVGIGTSSPGAILHTVKTSSGASTVGAFLQNSSSTTSTEVRLAFAANANSLSEDRYGWVGYVNTGGTNGGALTFATNPGGTPATEHMRIDSSGNLLVGKTATALVTSGFEANATGMTATNANAEAANFNRQSSDGTLIIFRRANSGVGTISITTTATSYNTVSDYRLKDTIAPMQGALDRVAALKPVTYKWKVDGSDGQGFIAHELQEVVPDAVRGVKDEIDENGNPVYQGIDTSFLVATLTAAIQEQQALITSLTARIAALEGTQP